MINFEQGGGILKSLHGASSDKVIRVKSKMLDPVKQSDGTWKVVIREFEEEIPDLGREELICNHCGWPDYPKCKEDWCKAWVRHTKKS